MSIDYRDTVDHQAWTDHRAWLATDHWPVTPDQVIEADDEYTALVAAHETAEATYGYGSPQEQAASDAIDAYLGIGGDAA